MRCIQAIVLAQWCRIPILTYSEEQNSWLDVQNPPRIGNCRLRRLHSWRIKTARRLAWWLIFYPLPQANSDENVEEENLSAHSPPADDPMSCPMCDRRFPVSEIELHAMYCNGTEDDSIQDSPGLLDTCFNLPFVHSSHIWFLLFPATFDGIFPVAALVTVVCLN